MIYNLLKTFLIRNEKNNLSDLFNPNLNLVKILKA